MKSILIDYLGVFLLVSLVRRQCTNKCDTRDFLYNFIILNFCVGTILVEDIVFLQLTEHNIGIVHICNVVVNHLTICQRIVIHANIVDVKFAVLIAEGNSYWWVLDKVIAGIILDNIAHNTVKEKEYESLLCYALHDKSYANTLVLLELGTNLLFESRLQITLLGVNSKANNSLQATNQHSLLIIAVATAELNFNGLTCILTI